MPDVPVTAAYAIDADGTITWVDDAFATRAVGYGQPELADGGALGRPLTDFVAGERPRALQRALVDRARTLREPLEVRYRCDAPDLRRHAVLRLDVQPGGGVVFTTWFESTEERPYQPMLDYARPRAEDVVGLCAWCNRVDAGGWREVEEVASGSSRQPRITHTVCDICELLLMRGPRGGR
jgi:hypothetical protein